MLTNCVMIYDTPAPSIADRQQVARNTMLYCLQRLKVVFVKMC